MSCLVYVIAMLGMLMNWLVLSWLKAVSGNSKCNIDYNKVSKLLTELVVKFSGFFIPT